MYCLGIVNRWTSRLGAVIQSTDILVVVFRSQCSIAEACLEKRQNSPKSLELQKGEKKGEELLHQLLPLTKKQHPLCHHPRLPPLKPVLVKVRVDVYSILF